MLKLSFSLLLVLLTACATGPNISTDYNPDYQFDDIKTFSLVARQRDKVSDINSARIDAAIREALSARILDEVAADKADILVDYLVITQGKTKIRSYNTGHGYSCYRCWGGHNQTSQVDVSNYVEGSLIIDLVDSKDKKTIWRGMGSKPVNAKRTPEERTAIINEYTEAIINAMPLPPRINAGGAMQVVITQNNSYSSDFNGMPI